MKRSLSSRGSPASMHRQSGVILIIALIVLVSMTLAAIGMSRSIDTANVIAGNLGFKQSSLNAADQGLRAGFQWLVARAGTTALNNSDLTQGYFSATTLDEPKWEEPATWDGAAFLNNQDPDAAGNVISYVVQRLCSEPNTPYNGTGATGLANRCAQTLDDDPTSSGQSKTIPPKVFKPNPSIFYRITARAQGPRNTESYVQTIVGVTN